MDMHDINFNEWPQAVNCAITVCDTDGVILYMNCLLYTSDAADDSGTWYF